MFTKLQQINISLNEIHVPIYQMNDPERIQLYLWFFWHSLLSCFYFPRVGHRVTTSHCFFFMGTTSHCSYRVLIQSNPIFVFLPRSRPKKSQYWALARWRIVWSSLRTPSDPNRRPIDFFFFWNKETNRSYAIEKPIFLAMRWLRTKPSQNGRRKKHDVPTVTDERETQAVLYKTYRII